MPTIYTPRSYPTEPNPGTRCDKLFKILRTNQKVSTIVLARRVSHRFGEYIRQLRVLGWRIEVTRWSYQDSDGQWHRPADYELILPRKEGA